MRRILIVDDNLQVANTVAILFRTHGFEVVTAYSAAEALLRAREFHPELLVCDVNMPGRSGLELMQDICTEMPGCKIIVLSAQHSNRAAVIEQSRRMPQPATFLLKPCNPRDLIREAGTMLSTA